MKKLFLLLGLIMATLSITWAQNFEMSTLKIGPYKLNMSLDEAEKLAGKQLIISSEKNDYNGDNFINYNGETIIIRPSENYYEENPTNKYIISSLSTQSPKFKTKSGIGIGSTKEELFQAFKNYAAFYYSDGYDDEGNRNGKEGFFSLSDIDAGTEMMFNLKNNRVTEITINYHGRN